MHAIQVHKHVETMLIMGSWPAGRINVTGFQKADRNITLGLFPLFGPANSYTHTLPGIITLS